MKKKASTALQEIATLLKPFPCFFVLSLRVDAEISTRSTAREGAKRREKAITLASAAASNQYFLFVGFLSFFGALDTLCYPPLLLKPFLLLLSSTPPLPFF